VEGLSTLEGMPQDPNVQRQIGEIRDRVAHAQAQHIAGRPKDGLKLAETAASQALEISYRPLQAEALIVLGKLREKLQPDKAERTYIEAIKAAEAGRADEERVLAAIRMVNVLGSSGKHEQAQLWGELAQAVLDRLSGHEELQLELLVSLARSHLFAGANREALRAYEKALALSDKALPTDVRRGEIFNGLGILFVYPEFRDLDKSARALEQAIALVERTRGKNHPAVAYAHRSFIDTSVEKGDFKGALEHAQIAYDIFSSAFGPDHPDTLSVIEWRATVFFELRQYRESLVEAERALETRRASNPEDPELSYSYQNVGKALVALNRAQEAIPLLERCLKMFEADKSVHRKDLGEARYYLARALFESRRDQDRAIALANKAREDLIAGGKAKKADEVARWLAGLKRGGRSALGYRMRE
jgi:tetratricopeptide (TPR) repeat protein